MSYFVKIEDPKKLRINLLETTRSFLIIAREHKLLQDIRERKRLLIEEARSDLKKIIQTANSLNDLFPEDAIKDEAKKEALSLREEVEESIPQQAPKLTDLDRLQYTLDKIEGRLSQIERE